MPANLTPEYLAAEERYRRARTPEEKLAALREMLATVPKHKGTERLQAEIKRKIAQLRQQPKKKGPSRSATLDYIEPEGAGQVALVGLPNSGKSTILARLTNAKPEVADYPFSTLRPLPGMMDFEDIQIQLVDLPPLSREYTEGWVYAHIRNADLVLLTVDLGAEEPELELLETLKLLEEAKIKLDSTGGGFREGFMVKRALGCGTKLDLPGAPERLRRLQEEHGELRWVGVAAAEGRGLEELRRALFEALDVIRVYTKEPGKKPDMEKPYILPRGSTVLDVARAIHQELAENFRYARLWGSSRFAGQQVPRDHPVQDKDIVEIHA